MSSELYPATYRQEAHFNATTDGWSTLNVGVGLRVPGSMEPVDAQPVVDELVARHAALRTRFARADGRLEQRVLREMVVAVQNRAAHGPTPTTVESFLNEPTHLDGGALTRAALCCAPDGALAIVLSAHHAICDGYSLSLLARELDAMLGASRRGRPGLGDVQETLGAYGAWERELDVDRQRSFWREHLRGASSRLQIGGLRAADYRPAFLRAVRLGPLSPEVGQRAAAVARHRGTTLPRLIAAVVAASLRSFLAERAVLGWVTANRERSTLIHTVGEFEDVLPVRVDVQGVRAFGELVEQVDDRLLDSYEHQMPSALLDPIGGTEDDGDGATFDIIINCLPERRGSPSAEALVMPRLDRMAFRVNRWRQVTGTLVYQVHLRADGNIEGYVVANVNAVTRDLVASLVRRFAGALTTVGDDGDVPLDRLDSTFGG